MPQLLHRRGGDALGLVLCNDPRPRDRGGGADVKVVSVAVRNAFKVRPFSADARQPPVGVGVPTAANRSRRHVKVWRAARASAPYGAACHGGGAAGRARFVSCLTAVLGVDAVAQPAWHLLGMRAASRRARRRHWSASARGRGEVGCTTSTDARPHLQGHTDGEGGGDARRPAHHQRLATARQGVERRQQSLVSTCGVPLFRWGDARRQRPQRRDDNTVRVSLRRHVKRAVTAR